MGNVYFWIILIAILAEFVLSTTANLLNVRSLRSAIPATLRGIYDEERYQTSQEYTRVTTRFGILTDIFELAVLFAFWFAGGFNWLDMAVRSWGFIPLVNGLLYILILYLGYSILTLPFSVYATFVIEERFGFNRTTPRTFIMDHLKSLLLLLCIGMPLLAGVLAFFEYTGQYAWLYCWIAVTLISLLLQYITPTVIMPLFNKFTPLDQEDLREAIMEYAKKVGFHVANIFVMDGSKRSAKSNAFFTGFGKNRRIALFDTLIGNHSIPELVAVLAHEIGHYKKKHIVKGTLIGIAHTGLLFYLLSLFLTSQGLHDAFLMTQISLYTGMLFFSLLYTPIELFLSMGLQAFSRKHEYEADRFAATTIDDPHSMVAVLKKLASDNLSNLTPHPFYVFLNYSHPPLLQRITAIEQAAHDIQYRHKDSCSP